MVFVSLLFSQVNTSDFLKVAWEKEAGINLSVNLWSTILQRIRCCTINARLQLIQFIQQCLRFVIVVEMLRELYLILFGPAENYTGFGEITFLGILLHTFRELTIFGCSDTVLSLPYYLQLANPMFSETA